MLVLFFLLDNGLYLYKFAKGKFQICTIIFPVLHVRCKKIRINSYCAQIVVQCRISLSFVSYTYAQRTFFFLRKRESKRQSEVGEFLYLDMSIIEGGNSCWRNVRKVTFQQSETPFSVFMVLGNGPVPRTFHLNLKPMQ